MRGGGREGGREGERERENKDTQIQLSPVKFTAVRQNQTHKRTVLAITTDRHPKKGTHTS